MSIGIEDKSPAKLGLALSGGGFRASFFHLGVLKRLAELGVLGQVEVLSTVSGGSIIAALYVLILKREIEGLPVGKKGELEQGDFERIVKDVEGIFIKGVRKDLRTRLLMNPFATTWIMLTSWSLGDRMARLYERHLYRSVIRDLREAEKLRTGRDPGWSGSSIPLSALRFSPPGESFEGGLDAYNRKHDTKIPKFILNATCLNSGRNWRFTSVEIGDPLLGIFRADEVGVLDPAQMKQAGINRPEWDLVPRLKVYLEKRSREQLLTDLRSGLFPEPATPEVLIAEYLLRFHRDGQLGDWEKSLAPGDDNLFRIPLAWESGGLKLEDLLGAEFGDLYRAKVEAWYLHRGEVSYRQSGSEGRFWEGLRRIGGPKVDGLRQRAEADPAFRGQLMDFVTDLYYARIAWMAGETIGADVRRIRLSEAVAASACFPPVFAPFAFLGLFDDRRIPIVRLVDGGVYDNQGLTALFEEGCTHIIASDAGKLLEVEPRVQGSRTSMLGRITSVLSGALRGSQLLHLSQEWEISTALGRARSLIQPPDADLEKAAQGHDLQQMAFFHMSKPPEMGDPRGLPAHEAAVAVAEIRTDLDAFGDAEVAALAYQGYNLCDRFVRKNLSGPPFHLEGQKPPEHPPTPPRLKDHAREKKIIEVGAKRALRALRLGSIEAWAWTILAVAVVIGGTWLVPVSIQGLGTGVAWVLRALRVNVSARVPLGLVLSVVLAVVGFRVAWPSAYRRVSQVRGVATFLKLARSLSGLVFLFVILLPFWIALVASLVALFSYYCQARPFLRATKVF